MIKKWDSSKKQANALRKFFKIDAQVYNFIRVAHGDSTMLRLSLPSNVQAPTKLTIFGWRPT